jgi:hypothetical protein
MYLSGGRCVVVEPLSLAVLAASALKQGIAFLYGQLGELLRGRRERRAQSGAAAAGAGEIPPAGEAGQVLDGSLAPGPLNEEALERHADQMAALQGLLFPYAEGDRQVDPTNRQLLDQVEAARLLLEQIYKQHITFKGEQRPATGSPLQLQTGDVEQYIGQVIASGERAVAIGGPVTSSTIITGDQTSPGDPPAPGR